MAFYANSDPRIISVVKTADETVNNSSVVQDDDELKVFLAANEVLSFVCIILGNWRAASDFKYTFVVPAGGAVNWKPTSTVVGSFAATSEASVNVGSTSDWVTAAHGIVVNGATSGYLQLQWAQDAAVAEDTKVLAGSSIIAWK